MAATRELVQPRLPPLRDARVRYQVTAAARDAVWEER